MKKILAFMLVLIMVFALVSCTKTETPASQAPASEEPAAKNPEDYTGNLVVYSPHDADPLNAGITFFQETYPNIKVDVVAAGTGELLQRVQAESANPIADVLWGGGADSLAAYKDYFQPYVCANDAVIDDAFKDADDLWIGESPLPMVIIYNKQLLDETGVTPEALTEWSGLLDPALKGKIAYASPAKSGSAFTQLCTMIFAAGSEDAGWEFVQAFYANLDGKVQDSSGNCHKLVASGEYTVGVTIEKSAVLYADNDNIGYVYPKQNSAVPDGVALVKDCPDEENARLFIDFVTGYDCQKAQNADWKRRPVRSDLTPEGLVPLSDIDLCSYDFDWAANNKAGIIEHWQDIMVG